MLKWRVMTQEQAIAEERERLEDIMVDKARWNDRERRGRAWIPVWVAKTDAEHV